MLKVPFVSSVMIVGALALARPASAQPPAAGERSDDAKAIRAHIESIFQAFIDKDRAKLEQTHGRDWRGFTAWSSRPIRGRDGYMQEATFPPGLPKGQGMVGYRISEFDVVFYGNAAVVSFVADLDLMFGTEAGHQKLTLLDVYHKEPEGWIQVASNTSLHPEEIERAGSQYRVLDGNERASLLTAREAVWRTWFQGDTEGLGKLVPPELITVSSFDADFGTRESTLSQSRSFATSGAKLTRLAFPRTEIQAYGNTAIIYTTYEMDITSEGRTSTERGSATEVFVRQNGRWINTGWQLAPSSQ
jgi:ketosteroid isomerase-like protein